MTLSSKTHFLGQALFTLEGSKSPPAISRAFGSGLANVTVVFSKPIADKSAIPGNFKLGGGLTVTHAVLDRATRREVTLTTSLQRPFTTYSMTINGVRDRTEAQLEISTNATTSFNSIARPGAGSTVAEASRYKLVYSLDIPDMPDYADGLAYTLDHRAEVSGFSRIAYCMELQSTNGSSNFVWVSMDAFTTNIDKVGVPTVASGAFFQQPITNMNVQSSMAGIVVGTNLTGGNLEFWPQDSSMINTALVPNASDGQYDWGDNAYPGIYGSMQVHNHDAKQVLFAFNRWGGWGGVADLGIGNNLEGEPDWTFATNASSYVIKTLQVYVIPNPKAFKILGQGFQPDGNFSVTCEAQTGIAYSLWRKPELSATDWTRVAETIATSITVTLEDTQATNRANFYQIRAP